MSLLSVILFSSGLAAQKYSQSADFSLNFNTMQGFEPAPIAFTGLYSINSKRLSAEGGLLVSAGESQITLKGAFDFIARPKIHVGSGVIYNFNVFYDISLSNNFLPTLFIKWKPCTIYQLSLDLSFFLKLRTLFVLKDYQPLLLNTSAAFRLRNDFYLPRNINLFIEVSSIETFRYMILCAPSFSFGGLIPINEKIELQADATIHYIDFFTLSANYEDTTIRLGVKYKW